MNDQHCHVRSDRIVAELPAPERLLTWAIRAWAAHHADLSPIWWNLDRAFARVHASAALPHFHQMMASIFTGLAHWPDIRSVACPRLGQQEVQLLQLLASAPCGDRLGAEAALRSWVVRPALPIASREAYLCVSALQAAGVRLRAFAARRPRASPASIDAMESAASLPAMTSVGAALSPAAGPSAPRR